MRALLVLVAGMLVVPVASAAQPSPGVNLVCDAEWFLYGGAEACEEMRDPFRLYHLSFCILIEFFSEDPQTCPQWADVQTSWGTYYVGGGHGVQEESNGCEGQQTEASDCDGDGDVDPADHVVTLEDYA